MNKVTPIDRGMYLREYCASRNVARIPEGIAFAVGVLMTVILPQLILSAYGGIITLAPLAAVTALGSIAGLLAFLYLPYRMPRCVDAEIRVQAPPSRDGRLKKVA